MFLDVGLIFLLSATGCCLTLGGISDLIQFKSTYEAWFSETFESFYWTFFGEKCLLFLEVGPKTTPLLGLIFLLEIAGLKAETNGFYT